MTYTEMWASMDAPTKPDNHYKNLTANESGYFEGLAIALAHWPEDRKCPPEGIIQHTHNGNTDVCRYQYILDIYNDLHVKECGK